ncbi:helix-turn-helix domain containing protein [Vagococcus luciliae]|uniref:Uncharacterized protein n=1 Tax=Vagococcus luciliae TaxID=2920380 RepID=A0ABY5NYM1_9ENTE|nr:helix-turn-helix domain containing protein [Vagococcus luciliae]UUV98617.1 hypothetical protein G314FT_07700 [Vagococcus luciliae]
MGLILNKSTERQRQLILFIARNYEWVTAQELADYLDCNIKTVRQDISYLEENYADIITVEYSKQLGYRFYTMDGRNVLEIYLNWSQESLFFSILSDCFFGKNTSLDYFYDTYFISETTLKRQMSLINRTLKKLGISVSSSTGQLKVKDERILRFFYALFIIEKQSIYEWKDMDMNQKILFDIIGICEQYFNINLSNIQKNIFSFFIYTSVIRSSQDKFLDFVTAIPSDFEQIVSQSLKILKHESTFDVFLTSEAHYRDSLQFVYVLFSQLADHYHSQEVEGLTTHFIFSISSKMKVDEKVLDYQGIKKELAYVSFMNDVYPYQLNLVSLRSELNAKSIKLQYPIFYDIVSQSLKELEINTPWIRFYKPLLISRAFRYWDYKEFESLTKIKPVSIVVSTTLEKNHAEILSYILKQTFQAKIRIVGLEYEKTLFNSKETRDSLNKVDIVITNHLFYHDLDNVIIVDDVIENNRLEAIKRLIDGILMKNTEQGLE